MIWKGLILDNFHFERMKYSEKDRFWTVPILGGSGGLESTDFG